MKRKLFALILCAMLIAMMMPVPALAVGDTTPPVVASYSFDKSSYATDDTIIVTATVYDELSKINPDAGFVIIKMKDHVDSCYSYFAKFIPSGEENTYIAKFSVSNDGIRSGDYFLEKIQFKDMCDNFTWVQYTTYENSSVRIHVENMNLQDNQPPEILSLTADRTSAAVGDTINFRAVASDASGINGSIVVYFEYMPNIMISSSAYLWPVSGEPGVFAGKLKITSDIPDAYYNISKIWLRDNCNNVSIFSDNNISEATPLPESAKLSFKVNNPDNMPNSGPAPMAKSITLSKTSVYHGDSVKISMEIESNSHSIRYINLGFLHVENHHGSYLETFLYKNENGLYENELLIPPNMPITNLQLSYISCVYDNGKYIAYSRYEFPFSVPDIKVISPFSGTENTSVLLNGSFDPMSGITIVNESEGDMTGKVEVSGHVDTGKVGIYLLTYKVPSNKLNTYHVPHYYYDFRWVGVSAVQPDPSFCDPGTLVIAGGNVNIDTNGSSALLTRDGVAVSLASSVSSPGKYTVSLADGSSKSGKFTISRISPAISASCQGSYPSKLTVAVKCSDPTGIAETRWMAGNVSLDTVRAQGKTFRNTFVTSQFGDYTVYARNKLGNETVKKVTLQYTAVTGVSVSTSSVKLAVGQTCQLAPILAPATCTFPNVIWSSSNPAVARVDSNGLVEALSPGSARIMVRALDGGKTSFCVVSVMAPPEVVSVVISSAEKTVCIGSVFRLTATVSPSGAANKTITWSSSNTRVVAVGASGSFRAIGVGTATIYAKANNGAYAVCKITVTPELVQAGLR